jgi:CRP-like cAMP-binding protein
MESIHRHEQSRNALLERFPAALRAEITSHAEIVPLRQRQVLCRPDRLMQSVYFPLDCLISVMLTLADGQAAEMATAGPEGMLGVYALLQGEAPFFEAVVQAPGRALRFDIHWLRNRIATSREAQDLLSSYGSFLVRQVAQLVVCNAVHRIEQRCCRWLLTTSRKLGTEALPLTHEYLAFVLGVRRPGLTMILGQLQKLGLLRLHRGRIELVDRVAVATHACECYGAVADHYVGLFGTT